VLAVPAELELSELVAKSLKTLSSLFKYLLYFDEIEHVSIT
jgi:hypothetical protein